MVVKQTIRVHEIIVKLNLKETVLFDYSVFLQKLPRLERKEIQMFRIIVF